MADQATISLAELSYPCFIDGGSRKALMAEGSRRSRYSVGPQGRSPASARHRCVTRACICLMVRSLPSLEPSLEVNKGVNQRSRPRHTANAFVAHRSLPVGEEASLEDPPYESATLHQLALIYPHEIKTLHPFLSRYFLGGSHRTDFGDKPGASVRQSAAA